MLYLGFKLLHVAAVVMFLGNITTGLFWKSHADRSHDPRVILSTLEGIIRSDRLFTIPGVVAIVTFGLVAAIVGQHPILRTGWIFWAIVLFSASGIAFMWKVASLQSQLVKLARRGVERGAFEWEAYHALSREWEVWGAVALIAPAVALMLMVLKVPVRGL
jgi:uncharacterized membrane protein